MAVATPASAPPRHASRATREGGRRTRTALLDAAASLFAGRGAAAVSVGEVAAAADAFPSQVTYYFGSKEALFCEAACREVLHLAAEVEAVGARATTRLDYATSMAETALASPALAGFAEALLMARGRPELEPQIHRTLDRLHRDGAAAFSARCAAAAWATTAPPLAMARGFWAVVLGLALERAAAPHLADPAAATAAVLGAFTADERPEPPEETTP